MSIFCPVLKFYVDWCNGDCAVCDEKEDEDENSINYDIEDEDVKMNKIEIIENELCFIKENEFWYARNNRLKKKLNINNKTIINCLNDILEDDLFDKKQIIQYLLLNMLNEIEGLNND